MFEDEELGSDAWLDRLAHLARSLGSRAFEQALPELLNGLVPVDHCVVFTYSDDGLGHLFTHGPMLPERARELADDYVRRYHARDPMYARLADTAGPACDAPRPLDLTAEYDRAYRNHFFDRNGLIDKTSIIGAIEHDRVLCNFYRMRGSAPYSADEHRRLQRVLPLVAALVAAHYRVAKGAPAVDGADGDGRTRSLVHTVLSTHRPPFDRLTVRERQVCERILLGYTSLGIGLDLEIALNSVLTYRKRAYQKLGISTQAELFALCLRNGRTR